jgi:hypothetical protein
MDWRTCWNCLIDRILFDSARLKERRSRLVVLGDFIDRGSQPSKIVHGLYAQRRSKNLIVLLAIMRPPWLPPTAAIESPALLAEFGELKP